MARKKLEMPQDEVSMQDLVLSGAQRDEVELISDPEVIEELSDEAKKMQEQALLSAREQALSIIDRKKLPLALKEINGIQMAADIFDDEKVLTRVKENVKSAMDLKFLAEYQKIRLQNLQTLMRMDSVNESGTAGEVFVGLEFSGSGGGTTKIVVGKK